MRFIESSMEHTEEADDYPTDGHDSGPAGVEAIAEKTGQRQHNPYPHSKENVRCDPSHHTLGTNSS